jgi:LacI family transcriptional regulator, repressor for deo operon, udp, cdd, tsx, nupC, and nupG
VSDVSIKQVARLAGVSIATVSRCLNNPEKVTAKTRAKVERAISKTGYTPNEIARNFRRGRSNMIMVVLPSIGDPFFTKVMLGIREAASRTGYSLLIDETAGNTITADEIGAMVVSKQAEGIILLASLSPFGTEVVSTTSRRALPIVIGCETMSPELAQFPAVRIDNSAAAADATNYLIQYGHRRIAMISGQKSSFLTRDREAGYRGAMAHAGLAIEDGWIVYGRLTIDGACEATRALLGHAAPPTAIFCANDLMAVGCMHEIRSAGLDVPQHVSVIGFDDIALASVLDPPLTTIRQPAQEIGRRVMYRLCREIEHGRHGDGHPEIVPHELVVRASVAAPVRGGRGSRGSA